MALPAATANMLCYAHDETEDLRYCRRWFLNLLTPANRLYYALLPRKFSAGNPARRLHRVQRQRSGCASRRYTLTERLNKIVQIDERNLQATVEPGVITQVFQETVIARGFFYPPDPSRRGQLLPGRQSKRTERRIAR